MIPRIVQAVAEVWGIPSSRLTERRADGRKRTTRAVEDAILAVYWIARTGPSAMSYPEIAGALRRTPDTVLRGVRRMDHLIQWRGDVREKVLRARELAVEIPIECEGFVGGYDKGRGYDFTDPSPRDVCATCLSQRAAHAARAAA